MGQLRLFVKSPGSDERVYEVSEGEVTVGRDPAVGIPVDDKTLSRRHCKVYLGADGWRVTDLGSRNGTYLNGARLTKPQSVNTGDRIQVGYTVLEAQ